MKFIHEKDSCTWWEYYEEKAMAINFYGANHTINKDSEQFKTAKFVEANNWHDLYVKYGYCCLDTGMFHSAWISPDGVMFIVSDAHATTAAEIVEVVYGISDEHYSEDFLRNRHWIKISAGILLQYYISQGFYQDLTAAQYSTLTEWCKEYNIHIEDLVCTI